jgi:hypothetical protein
VWIKGSQDLFREKLSSLFMFMGWSSISSTSLTFHSLHLGVLARTLVFCNRMQCPRFMLSSAIHSVGMDMLMVLFDACLKIASLSCTHSGGYKCPVSRSRSSFTSQRNCIFSLAAYS